MKMINAFYKTMWIMLNYDNKILDLFQLLKYICSLYLQPIFCFLNISNHTLMPIEYIIFFVKRRLRYIFETIAKWDQ